MRVSSFEVFNIVNRSLSTVNEDMIKTQQQMSSGKRVLTPADDPVAATKIMQITEELAGIEQYRKNIDIAQNNLSIEESALMGVDGLIQRIQEIALSAANTATMSENEYAVLASEVEARLDELVNLMNSKNANGDYIFGGFKSAEEPFTGTATSGFQYHGDDGQQYIKVANSTTIASTDSGKTAFLDVASANNTVDTYASPSNTSSPPVQISVGQVVDQGVYDDFYPEDMVITFNADTNLNPPGKNFTVTERSSNRVILADQPYLGGNEVTIQGVSVRISGSPVSGEAAEPATRLFGTETALALPVNFTTPADETFTVKVAGRVETMVLDGNVTSTADLAAILNSGVNGNAERLANLGLTVDAQGFHMASGVNFEIRGGSTNADDVMGLTVSTGSESDNGVQAQAGDRLFIDSSNKQGLLTTMARFSGIMRAYDGSPESRDALEETVASTVTNLQNAQTSVLDVVSKIGARVNTLESTRNLHFDSEVVSKKILSEIRDVDYAEAATRLSQQTLILQAAQQAFVRVSQLTLFNQL